jgi:hypothetical protein
MFKEVVSSFKDVMRERAVSPVSGAFVGFWLIFNWRAIAVFFLSDESIIDRIDYITAHYINPWPNLYFPALCALLFVVVYPVATLGPYYLWELAGSWKVKIRQEFEGSVLLSVERSLALMRQVKNQERDFLDQMESKDARVATAERMLSEKAAELQSLEDSLANAGNLEGELVKLNAQLALAAREGGEMRAALQEESSRRQHAEVRLADLKREYAQSAGPDERAARELPLSDAELQWVRDYEKRWTQEEIFRKRLNRLVHALETGEVMPPATKAQMVDCGVLEATGDAVTRKGMELIHRVGWLSDLSHASLRR